MYKDYASPVDAQVALVQNGIREMRVELLPVMGGRIQPIVLCDFERDAEIVMARGFNARLINDYAVD